MFDFNTSDEVIPCGCGFDDVSFPHSCNPKINYHFNVWETQDIWVADIRANSDFLVGLSEFASEKEARIAANAFIQGIKFARGEK
jgi:hypothetical protein